VKRTYAILMFMILFVNSAGFYVYYVVQLQQIHAEMRERLRYLPDDELELFVLSTKKYQDSKVDENELKLGGKMYDIARVKLKDDLVFVYCVHDKKEDNLLTLIGTIVSEPLEDRSDIPVTVMNFISLIFLSESYHYQSWKQADVDSDSLYLFSIQLHTPRIDCPPPRQTC
jgi:hypothetical protein